MTFLDKIKTTIFWKNTSIISLVFFVTIVIISLLINSFSAIIKFDFELVKTQNFAEGKWINFFLIKGVLSIIYGIWVTSRKMK